MIKALRELVMLILLLVVAVLVVGYLNAAQLISLDFSGVKLPQVAQQPAPQPFVVVMPGAATPSQPLPATVVIVATNAPVEPTSVLTFRVNGTPATLGPQPTPTAPLPTLEATALLPTDVPAPTDAPAAPVVAQARVQPTPTQLPQVDNPVAVPVTGPAQHYTAELWDTDGVQLLATHTYAACAPVVAVDTAQRVATGDRSTVCESAAQLTQMCGARWIGGDPGASGIWTDGRCEPGQ